PALAATHLNLPHILVLLDVDFVKLALDGRDDIVFHFHRDMLWKYGEQEPFLEQEDNDLFVKIRTRGK
ncbi:hypothetical protein HHI36_007650, partial [Cryptolaemus montrouzieri]